MIVASLILALLLLGGGQTQQNEGNRNHVSRAEFESLQKDFNSLQKELNYWQNTTIDILRRYLINSEDTSLDRCTANDDSFVKDKLEEVLQKVEGTYNSTQVLDSQLSSLNTRLSSVEGNIESMRQEISQLSDPMLGLFLNPAPSCKLIPQGSLSRHYWIQNAGTGYASLEYCDMTRRCCNSTGGWMRVAHLDMTDTNQHCPSGFRLITSPKRTCGTPGRRCVSTTFPVNGVKYSRVCGKIIGYQQATTDAFDPYYKHRSLTIDDQYVDGVSLTHGQRPRKHIWTFVAAHDETRSHSSVCPCTKTNSPYTGAVPPFIGQDYFCDTGSRYNAQAQFYHADPLWDGSGCGPTSSCCGFNNPPWFCKQLPLPTTDNIEMRVCINQETNDEEVALESVEIYVQ